MKGYAYKNNSHNFKDELQSYFCFFAALRKMSVLSAASRIQSRRETVIQLEKAFCVLELH